MIREVVITNNHAGDERRILKRFAEGWDKNYGREGGVWSPAFELGDALALLNPDMIDGSCFGMEPYVGICHGAKIHAMVKWRHPGDVGEPAYEQTPKEWMKAPFRKYMTEQCQTHGAAYYGWLVSEVETCFAVLNDRKTAGCNFFKAGAELVALHSGYKKEEPYHKFNHRIPTIKVAGINGFGLPQVFEVALDAVMKKV